MEGLFFYIFGTLAVIAALATITEAVTPPTSTTTPAARAMRQLRRSQAARKRSNVLIASPSSWVASATVSEAEAEGRGSSAAPEPGSATGAGSAPRKNGELHFLLVGLGGKCLDVEDAGTAAGTATPGVFLYPVHLYNV